MARRRIDPNSTLPPGLNRHGNKFRTRSNDTWIYFAGDQEEASRRYRAWQAGDDDPYLFWMKCAQPLIRAVKKNAASRGIPVAITEADVAEMLRASRGSCAVSGLPFKDVRPPGARIRPWFPSIDRIDNSQGYTRENCRIVCAYANYAMADFGLATLHHLAAAIVRHNRPALQIVK